MSRSPSSALTHDGASTYFINGHPVRWRDIQDIFRSTGLGPRACAIIGQGMISRIIESRPEELRVFLEEAAGVSKYKERRRETENRLGDTRENLLRVEDILRELNANLERLEAQAAVAQLAALGARHAQWQTQGEHCRQQLEEAELVFEELAARVEHSQAVAERHNESLPATRHDAGPSTRAASRARISCRCSSRSRCPRRTSAMPPTFWPVC